MHSFVPGGTAGGDVLTVAPGDNADPDFGSISSSQLVIEISVGILQQIWANLVNRRQDKV